jgi:hypothetical protein
MTASFKAVLHEVRIYFFRDIKVCDRWRHSYQNFLTDMGRAPSPKHQIDRIDGLSASN